MKELNKQNYKFTIKYKIMNLTLQHIEENIDTLELLGKGSNGMAFSIYINGIELVLKLTSSESEYKIALKLKKYQKLNPNYVRISSEILTAGKFSTFNLFYIKLKNFITRKNNKIDLDKLPYKYFIITEYLNVNNKIKKYSETKLYGKLFKVCIDNKTTISDVLNLNNKELKDFFIKNYDKKDKISDFYLVINILKLHKLLGSNDFHSGNIGVDMGGNIKAYDFDMAWNRKFKL